MYKLNLANSMMNRKSVVLLAVISVLFARPSLARELKEYDRDVNYEESRLPNYELPSALESVDGTLIDTSEEWMTKRRPEILSVFANMVYGRIPTPESAIETQVEIETTDKGFMDGAGTRKDVRMTFSNENGSAEMLFLVFTPNNVDGPAPVMMKHSFNSVEGDDFDADPARVGAFKNGWPIGAWFERGFGFVVVHQTQLVDHNETEFLNSIHRLFYKEGQSFPKANEWGVLSAMAWGAMRALDYLETDADVDASRVAIMGHSKCGKAALWTAALDQRFALAVSAQSGCAGAALWRRRSGETMQKMVTRFPYWLCRNAWKFANHESDLPVDQHMALALIAPRPVYVASGVEDTWADPRGEYLSAYHATEVYKLFGKAGLNSPETPPIGEPQWRQTVGYHIREGGHSVELYDWMRFIDFCEYHLN